MHHPTPSSPGSPGRAAWIAVAVLWMVSVLNYMDRLLIASMRDSLRADIAMTDAHFGLLASVFLWTYALFNPLGGYIADKFGSRRVILTSLAAWSLATWYTGHAHSFHELLFARALMGISEACYFPAGLALISNHHPGATRSFATGLFYTGINVGAALGGMGGYLADHFGWRFGFSLLGGVGVAYALAASVFLKDAKPPEDSSDPNPAPMEMLTAARSLLSNGSFWLYLIVFTLISLATWMIFGWMPTYLRQHFSLSQGAAGLTATAYVQAGGCLGVVGGGYWADRWSRSSTRARIRVAAVGLALAAPALFITASCRLLPLAIASFLCFGFVANFFSANCMPILRQISAEKYSATGYGILNMSGCIIGGLATYGAGILLDAKVSLGIAFQGTAVALALSAVALIFLRIRNPVRTAAASELASETSVPTLP